MYNPIKAAQVIAYFAMKRPSRTISILKAIKLVYLSDRESIKNFGYPILDEIRASMPHGPVNSRTYDYISGTVDLDKCGWSDFLDDKADHKVSAVQNLGDDDLGELSEADTNCLDSVWEKFGEWDRYVLRDWTHDPQNIPEWENPHGSSNPIPIERIMRSVGIIDPAPYVEELRAQNQIEKLLTSVTAQEIH